jgi:drug/metabolite transporter (DMT)-like permease
MALGTNSASALESPATSGARHPSGETASHVRASRLRLITAFAVVYIIWGSTYLAIRVAIESFPPLLMAGTRHITAGLFLFVLLRARRTPPATKRQWLSCVLLGVLLLSFSNGGLSWAEQTVPSGTASLLVATVSLWMVLVEWVRPGGTRPVPRTVLGLALGFCGLVFLVGPSHLGGARVSLLGAAVLVLSSLSWAVASVFSKHMDVPRSLLLATAMQSLIGGVGLWVGGIASGEGPTLLAGHITLRSTLALGYLVIFGSVVGFTAYTYLLRHAPPNRVATYAFVNPIVALFLGWVLAGEPLTPRTLAAGAVILTAVILVITAPHRDPAHAEDVVPSPGEA